MIEVEVLRVFTDDQGQYGNPLGVVLDGTVVPDGAQRQSLAASLGFSETIFIDDAERGRIKIFTPATEVPFAGHPTVGAAWVLARELGQPITTLHTPSGVVNTWNRQHEVWVRGLLGATPPWWHERLDTSGEVAEMTRPLSEVQDATQVWAWEDEAAGMIRARVFAARYGVAHDEATGSACMRLAAALGRAITVRHGDGSIVHAQPGPPGTAEIGGRVVSDGTVSHSLGEPAAVVTRQQR